MPENVLLEKRLTLMRASFATVARLIDSNLLIIKTNLYCTDEFSPGTSAESEIESLREHALMLLVRENPKARDLKFAMAALRIEHDYERINELIMSLAERVMRVGSIRIDLIRTRMSELLQSLLTLHAQVGQELECTRPSTEYLPPLPIAGEVAQRVRALESSISLTYEKDSLPAVFFVELILATRHMERIGELTAGLSQSLRAFELSELTAAGSSRG